MKRNDQVTIESTLATGQESKRPEAECLEWTKGVCPNCGFKKADVDGEGVVWCPACGYSKKGCYT